VSLVFAMGGGGFTMEPDVPALDELVLDLGRARGRREPRICFLPTASGDAEEQVRRFYATYGDRPCEPSHVSLFARVGTPLELLDQDVIYVGGGSMRNMLAIWEVHGLDRLLPEAARAGVVLAGLSAGAMCWFEGGVTLSRGVPEPVAGLGLLRGSLSVHRDGEPERWPVYRRAVADGLLPPGWAADDGCGLLFEDGRLVRAVASRPTAGAVRVERDRTCPLDVEFLGAPTPEHVPPASFAVSELRRLRYGSAASR